MRKIIKGNIYEAMSIRETINTVLELLAAKLFPLTHEEMKTGRGFGTQKERESCQAVSLERSSYLYSGTQPER